MATEREIALWILKDVLDEGKFLNLSLKEHLSKVPDQVSRRFITALTYATVQNICRVDFVLEQFTRGKRVHRSIRHILRLGATQLLFMEKVPQSAAVNESVKLAQKIGKPQLKGFVNGVLRHLAAEMGAIAYPDCEKEPARYLEVMYSYPKWLCEKYIADYGFDFTEKMLSYEGRSEYTPIRATKKLTSWQLEEHLKEKNLEYRRGRYLQDVFYVKNIGDISRIPWFVEGKIAVQSEASMLCVQALGIEQGHKVLDLCAAPGGKSAYGAEQAEGVQVVSGDIHPHRLELIRQNIQRMGLTSAIEVVHQDATRENPQWENGFDRVLIDAPCSALGLLYRKPDIKYHKREDDLAQLREVQRQIIEASAGYVKPGGRVVYCTCTIDRLENEENVEAFLAWHPEYQLENLSNILPASIMSRVKNGMLQLFPHIDGIDGFFIAAFRRKQSGE